ncbi:hypothetical protein [Dinghuibacter silviterrae]|nr:hypothetical protein [Dinghuibacter silviterrae]
MRQLYLTLCLSAVLLQGHAQTSDSVARSIYGDFNVHSPFKTLSVDRVSANGHKDSGTVDVVFTATNASTQTASLLFSMDSALSKASDDLDTFYAINQVRLGSNRKDPGTVTVVELRPDQAIHCGLYFVHVPLTARYITKLVLFTSLKLDEVSQGEDNIVLTNLEIHWK